MKVPYEQLSPEALRGVIESFVMREGTDYGAEFTLGEKVEHVRAQLRRGEVHILFDPASETVNIVTSKELRELEEAEEDDDVW